MSTFCPTAAAACWVARSVGRASSFRYGMPVAIAPDDTRMTSTPRPCAAERASMSGPIWAVLSPLTEEEPTLTTTRRACGTSSREAIVRRTVIEPVSVVWPVLAVWPVSVVSGICGRIILVLCLGAGVDGPIDREALIIIPDAGLALANELGARRSLRVHALEVVLSARLARRPIVRSEARVGAARSGEQLGRGGQGRLPVEDHAVARADDDGGSRDRAGLEQGVLDARLREAVGEEADRLLVGEVRLCHPALRLAADDAVDVAARASLHLHGEAGIICGLRAQHDSRCDRTSGSRCAIGLHELAERIGQFAKTVAARRRALEDAITAGLELGSDQVGQIAALGHVDLVERDELRPLDEG